MKIGILCYWGVPNYGAWAQAYALNHVVKKIVGKNIEVVHISYLHPIHFESYYKNDERLYNSFNYSYQMISHTDEMNTEQLEKDYFDIIITGSDSIWEFSVPAMGNDKHLIGHNLYANKLISYAASFGDMKFGMHFEPWITSGLKKYDYISVRDINSHCIVEKLSKRKAEIVLDPVLLWDFESDINVVKPIYTSYIAVYGSQWNSQFIEEAHRFAKEKKCKLISIGFVNNWCDMSLKMIELRGTEWIGMIKYADYVFTSMFHGLMFSVLFGKQFKFDRVSYVEQRSESLLKEIGGGAEIYVNNQKDYKEIFSKELRYEIIYKKLSKLKETSIDFLSYALKEDGIETCFKDGKGM